MLLVPMGPLILVPYGTFNSSSAGTIILVLLGPSMHLNAISYDFSSTGTFNFSSAGTFNFSSTGTINFSSAGTILVMLLVPLGPFCT